MTITIRRDPEYNIRILLFSHAQHVAMLKPPKFDRAFLLCPASQRNTKHTHTPAKTQRTQRHSAQRRQTRTRHRGNSGTRRGRAPRHRATREGNLPCTPHAASLRVHCACTAHHTHCDTNHTQRAMHSTAAHPPRAAVCAQLATRTTLALRRGPLDHVPLLPARISNTLPIHLCATRLPPPPRWIRCAAWIPSCRPRGRSRWTPRAIPSRRLHRCHNLHSQKRSCDRDAL